jgi:hypothetical protein
MDQGESKKHTKKADKTEAPVQRLMRKLGSLRGATPIFDPVPPAHVDAQTLKAEVLTIRLRRAWAWMIAHTTRFGSEHAVNKLRQDLSLADLAKDLGWDLPKASRVWAEGERAGLFRKENAYAGRLYITGTAIGCLPDVDQESPLFAIQDVVCTELLGLVSQEEIEAAEGYLKKDYIRRQLFGKPPAERAAAVKSLARLNAWGLRVTAEAMALVRQAVDEEEAAILKGLGVDRPKGKPRSAEAPSSLSLKLLQRSDGAAPPNTAEPAASSPLQVVPPPPQPAKPQAPPEPLATPPVSAPRDPVEIALHGIPGGNRDAARQLSERSRKSDPECLPAQVAQEILNRKEEALGQRNPIGWLMTYVPKAFIGGYQPTVVERKKTPGEVFAEEQRRKREKREKREKEALA